MTTVSTTPQSGQLWQQFKPRLRSVITVWTTPQDSYDNGLNHASGQLWQQFEPRLSQVSYDNGLNHAWVRSVMTTFWTTLQVSYDNGLKHVWVRSVMTTFWTTPQVSYDNGLNHATVRSVITVWTTLQVSYGNGLNHASGQLEQQFEPCLRSVMTSLNHASDSLTRLGFGRGTVHWHQQERAVMWGTDYLRPW